MSATVSIKGLNKADVLAVLYNRAQPQGMGFMHYDPTPMTREIAEAILKNTTDFDYLKGRVMKVNLSSDVEINVRGYDWDNGEGSAAEAIGYLRKTGDVNPAAVQAAHHINTLSAAEETKAHLGDKSGWESPGVFHLGLEDVADQLGPKVDEAVRRQRGEGK